jgi:RNA polymerase sigma-70 factor (ECF subfamily)
VVTGDGSTGGTGDSFLMESLQKGDEEAFRQIVDRFAGRLRAYAARRLPHGSAEVDDVLQETFLGLITNMGRLGEVRSLEAFLFSILRNKLVDAVRRSPKARGQLPLDAGTDSQPGREYAAPGATPSHYARREEASALRRKILADILSELLDGLKAEKRFRDLKVLELSFYRGWNGKETAAAAGTSEPTVTRIKADAVERLARLARRHPQADAGLASFDSDDEAAGLLGEVWRENLLSCVKRSTLGAHALGVLEKDWDDYVRFHLGPVGCETCAANLEDIREGEERSRPARERVFASSIGFLRRSRAGR